MQVTRVKEQELKLLIVGLRSFITTDGDDGRLQIRLLAQLEQELLTRFGMRLPE